MGEQPDESTLADQPELVTENMAAATDRLRRRSWMVAPLTTAERARDRHRVPET